MKVSQERTDRIAQLLASTPTDTVYVPLSKLKRRKDHLAKKNLKDNQLFRSKSTMLGIHDENSSIGSHGSFDSDFSYHTIGDNSLRERIRRMEERIKEEQEEGQLESLSPTSPNLPAEIYSWNKRSPRKIPKGVRPPVNIIGCHQPAEIIFARADERIRKQLHAKELKEKHMGELVKYLDHLIQMKQTRGERYAALLEQQQRLTWWLRVLTIVRYASLVFPIIQSTKEVRNKNKKLSRAAIKIQTNLISWYERKILLRYSNFISQIVDVVWKFRLYVAIFQKRRACRIIRTYLQEKRENREFAEMVHAFLAGVRKIQSLARNFIACKMSRIRALTALWEDLETQYIQTVLASRKHEMNSQSSRSMKNLVLDEKTRYFTLLSESHLQN